MGNWCDSTAAAGNHCTYGGRVGTAAAGHALRTFTRVVDRDAIVEANDLGERGKARSHHLAELPGSAGDQKAAHFLFPLIPAGRGFGGVRMAPRCPAQHSTPKNDIRVSSLLVS